MTEQEPTKQIDDGGPAVPLEAPRYEPEFGMSLRDWFAGQALSGLLADPEIGMVNAVDLAYEYAHAMLVRRKPPAIAKAKETP